MLLFNKFNLIMKNLLILAPLLLIFSSSFGQNPDLFVRPNPANLTDSFIYANDVVIYVENGIGLEVNTNNPDVTRASIYLRGDSQLIQGEKAASLNFGNGHLSVWQRGYANAFDYNYWASPIGNPNNSTIGNTNFGIPRIFDVDVMQDAPGQLHKTRSIQQQTTWDLNGVPSNVAEGDVGTLQISRRWIYTMRTGSGYSSWEFIGHQNGIGSTGLAPGEGFSMKGTGTSGYAENAHNQLYDFRGRPNDGNITIQVGHNGTNGLSTLTGNPYPSALDLAEFLMDPDNYDIEATAYFWDQDRTTNTHILNQISGGYGTWIPGAPGSPGIYSPPTYIMYDGNGNPLGGNNGSGAWVHRRFSPVGQGFIVKGNISGSTSGTATFKNSMRRHIPQGAENYSEFLRSYISGQDDLTANNTQNTYIENTLPFIRFEVEIHNQYARQMVLMFSPESTKGEDRGFDGRNISNINDGDAFWKLEETDAPFVIQTRPYDFYDMIPIHFRVKNGMNTFKINILESYSMENLAEEYGHPSNLYLYDQINNTYQEIDQDNIATIYHSTGAGIVEDRYFIVFRQGIQEENLIVRSEVNVGVFQNNPISRLQLTNPDLLDIKNASVYDMRGRLVINQNNIGKMSQYEFSTQGLSSGVYLVILTTKDNQKLDYKITIHNRN
jgi:hypothetical protein